jgi:hypothetical protein
MLEIVVPNAFVANTTSGFIFRHASVNSFMSKAVRLL